MEEKLVSYEVAKLAKEVGFNVVTEYRFFYNSELTTKTPSQSSKPTIYAPTQSLLQKWLREVHSIDITIALVATQYGFYIHKGRNYTNDGESYSFLGTYEQALEQAILKAIKLCKKK